MSDVLSFSDPLAIRGSLTQLEQRRVKLPTLVLILPNPRLNFAHGGLPVFKPATPGGQRLGTIEQNLDSDPYPKSVRADSD